MRAVAMMILCGCAMFGSVGVHAQAPTNQVDQIIDRVSAAYKVDRLNQASTIRFEEERRFEFPDHEYRSNFHELSTQRQHHILDLNNQSASSEYLTQIANSHWHGRSVAKDGKSRFILYAPQYVQEAEDQDFYGYYGRVIRSSAALLARELFNAKDTAKYIGEEMWMGKQHDKVTFEMPNSPPLNILVRKDSGMISYMDRIVGETSTVSYIYEKYEVQDGIPVAHEHSIYGNGIRLFLSLDRKLAIDDQSDKNAFEIEAGIVPEPQRVDQSAMTVEKTADNIFHVGQNEHYSTFISTNDGVVAFGMGPGFADRLQAYRQQTAIDLPLTHAIISDHHRGEMAGAPDAASTGATLLVTPDALDRVQQLVAQGSPAAQIETIENQTAIGDLVVANVSTAHAGSNLVAFHEPSGTFVQTAHFSILYNNAASFAEFPAVTLNDAVTKFDWTPKIILSAESRKAGPWQAFQKAVSEFDPTACFRNRRICQNWRQGS